ncbi:exosome complex exonuclease RRP42-like [Chelonus insularis]|uniref:exosome complex exonuclease RRP42-like n=1 Tax=Chelonus insularis TaxID=460826 RepID=UPI00158EFE22|nr:exosome complex exonuclease RRP42-like [Chelonus insularis]
MAENPLSLAEKTFILHGVNANIRTDGRSQLQYRYLEIETKLMPQTNGSARVRIGNTDVLVGIKAEIDTPFPDRPDQGKLEFFVDCSANATPEFEGKGGDDLAGEITSILTNAYKSSSAFNLEFLSILKYKKCWKMYVDILILQCGGNLVDAIGIGVKAALFSVEIPRITAATLDGGEADIQLSDDPFDCIRLNAENFPVLVTLCKIGENCIVDPTAEEEECAAASVVVSVVPNGKITAIVKTGYGSLQQSTLLKSLEIAIHVGQKLNYTLMEALKKEESLGPQRPIIGFLR